MYTTTNYPSKKKLRDAIASGERVTFYQPGPFRGNEPTNGQIYLEGPHFPVPHRWYAVATVANGLIVDVK